MVAVMMLLAVLWDSKIELWEAATLIALYVVYVIVVIGGTMLDRRREKKRRYEALLRDEFQQDDASHIPYHDDEPYRDEREYFQI